MLVTNDFNFTIYCLPYLVQSRTLPLEREEALFFPDGFVFAPYVLACSRLSDSRDDA